MCRLGHTNSPVCITGWSDESADTSIQLPIQVDARPHSTSHMILSFHTLRINDLVDDQWTNGRA